MSEINYSNKISDNKYSNNKYIDKSILPFIVIITLILGFSLGALIFNLFRSPVTDYSTSSSNIGTELTSNSLNSDYFNTVYDLIKNNYIGDVPTKDNLTYGAIKGVLASLGNEYNSFLTPEESKQYNEGKNPNFEGIGITLKFNGENSAIETTLSNYPGDKAGLKAGDAILEIDGEKVSGQLPNIIAVKIRGQKGTVVKLKILRKDNNLTTILDFNIIRDKINLDNITYKDLDNGLVKISIIQFFDTTAQDLNTKWDDTISKILLAHANSPIKGIVIDLRNNPGGYVASVRHILEEFLRPDTLIMSEQQKNKDTVAYKVTRQGGLLNIPIMVLVNEGSASASEIFASSIQDNNRGKVIGKPTVGKGVEQTVLNLKDGSTLIIVFQKWLSPNGKNIDKKNPIKPDYEVSFTEDDIRKGMDPQLKKAEDLLLGR